MAIGIAERRKLLIQLNPGDLLRPAIWLTPNALPVVGIDEVTAQGILFSLRAADHDGTVADAWLRALQCAQLAHDRLLRDLYDVDRQLTFWQRRVAAGDAWAHGAFMLLGRGPAAFTTDVADLATRGAAAAMQHLRAVAPLALRAAAATRSFLGVPQPPPELQLRQPGPLGEEHQQQHRPAGTTGRRGAAVELPIAGGAAPSPPLPPPVPVPETAWSPPSSSAPGGDPATTATTTGGSATATDLMQQRVLLLGGLRTRLARAVSELTQAAGILRLEGLVARSALGEPTGASSAPAAAAGPVGFAAAAAAVAARRLLSSSLSVTHPGPGQRQQQKSERGAMQEVENAVRQAVLGMQAALTGFLSYADGSGPEPDKPPPHQHQRRSPSGNGGGGGERPLSLELQDLLALLRLQPPAARALGLSSATPPRAAVAALWPFALPPQHSHSHSPGLQTDPAQGKDQRASAGGECEAASGTGTGGSGRGGSGSSMGLQLSSGGCSAAAALWAAKRAAALAGPLVPLPDTVRMPSAFQRHWLRYCAAGLVLLYSGLYLVRHSRLAGSDDLDRWILTAVSAVRAALRTHVVEPLAAVRDELFRTFRARPSIVSPDDFSASRQSLLRMLTAFVKDQSGNHHLNFQHEQVKQYEQQDSGAAAHASGTNSGTSSSRDDGGGHGSRNGGPYGEAPSLQPPQPQPQPSLAAAAPAAAAAVLAAGLSTSTPTTTTGAGGGPDEGRGAGREAGAAGGSCGGGDDDAAVTAGMAVLMRSYEAELRHPLRNLVLGDLARALLIQVQHVKVDGEAAMLRLDQILRANELSLSLMAALPALGLSLAVAAGAARLLVPRAPDPKRAAVPSRLAMASLELALARLATAEEEEQRQQQRQQPKQQQQEQQQREDPSAGVDAVTAVVAPKTTAAAPAAAVEELRGMVVYCLYQAYAEITALYAAADRTSRFSEWRQLYDDLLLLAAPAPPRERLATHQRMMRTYSIFQR